MQVGIPIAKRPVAVLKTDIQEMQAEDLGCPGTCDSPADCQGTALCPVNLAPPSAASTNLTDEEMDDEPQSKNFTSTRNACKLCTPLGACLAFRGVEGCIVPHRFIAASSWGAGAAGHQ